MVICLLPLIQKSCGISSRLVIATKYVCNSFFPYFSLHQDAFPDRYIECYIAEQNMVGVAMGCAARDRNIVFCNSFGAFLTRAYDQIRMGAISFSNVNFVGSHVGVCIGESLQTLKIAWSDN